MKHIILSSFDNKILSLMYNLKVLWNTTDMELTCKHLIAISVDKSLNLKQFIALFAFCL